MKKALALLLILFFCLIASPAIAGVFSDAEDALDDTTSSYSDLYDEASKAVSGTSTLLGLNSKEVQEVQINGKTYIQSTDGKYLFTKDGTRVAGFSPSGDAILSSSSDKCMLCGMFVTMGFVADEVGAGIFADLSEKVLEILVPLTGLSIVFYGLAFAGPFTNKDEIRQSAIKFFLRLMIVLSILGGANDSDVSNFIYKTIYGSLQDIFLGFGETILENGMKVSEKALGVKAIVPTIGEYKVSSSVGLKYAFLWSYVEGTISPFLELVRQKVEDASWGTQTLVFFKWGTLCAPFVFVMGVFCAFVIQTMFYFFSLGFMTPILLMGWVFNITKGWMGQCFKIMVTGGLTIIVASCALAFSASLLSGCIEDIINAVAPSLQNSTPLLAAVDIAESKLGLIDASEMGGTELGFMSVAYIKILGFGLITVLLHLQAPKIASNIGGASDTAATAAGVVAAGQMLGAKGLSNIWKGGKSAAKATGAGAIGAVSGAKAGADLAGAASKALTGKDNAVASFTGGAIGGALGAVKGAGSSIVDGLKGKR